jgi:hypothetical protein
MIPLCFANLGKKFALASSSGSYGRMQLTKAITKVSLMNFSHSHGLLALTIVAWIGIGKPVNATVITENCAESTFCTLEELENGGTIRVNDKLFSNWDASVVEIASGSPSLNEIRVSGLSDGGLDPGPGLRIEPTDDGELWNATGEPGYPFAWRLEWSFDVLVQDITLRIKDATLELGNPNVDPTDIASVVANEIIKTLADITLSTLQATATGPTSDSDEFDAVSSVRVAASLEVNSGQPTGNVEFSNANVEYVDLRFSQTTVPEPATLALVGLGLAGIGFSRRRKTR